MSDFLEQMAQGSRERARLALEAWPEGRWLEQALSSPPPPPLRLDHSGFDLIAELKLRSPAAGRLQSGAEAVVGERVRAYARAGAAAVSAPGALFRFLLALGRVLRA